MATIKRFEDVLSWQKAHALTGLVYRISGQGPFVADKSLREQIRRAAVSIGANIAEGFHRRGDKEFHQYLTQAKGSTGEVRALAYSARAAEYISAEQLNQIVDLTNDCERLLEGLRKYLRECGHKKPTVKAANKSPKKTGSKPS